MADIKKLTRKLLENLLVELRLESLDFKNIVPYPVSEEGKFEAESGLGEVSIENVNNEVEQGIIRLPTVVKQSYEFYKTKKPQHSGVYSLGFTIDEKDTQAKKTNYRELVRVLLTVVNYAKELVEKRQPFGVVILSADKQGRGALIADPQKKLVYDRLLSDNLPKGYAIAEVSVSTLKGKIVYRTTLPNKK